MWRCFVGCVFFLFGAQTSTQPQETCAKNGSILKKLSSCTAHVRLLNCLSTPSASHLDQNRKHPAFRANVNGNCFDSPDGFRTRRMREPVFSSVDETAQMRRTLVAREEWEYRKACGSAQRLMP